MGSPDELKETLQQKKVLIIIAEVICVAAFIGSAAYVIPSGIDDWKHKINGDDDYGWGAVYDLTTGALAIMMVVTTVFLHIGWSNLEVRKLKTVNLLCIIYWISTPIQLALWIISVCYDDCFDAITFAIIYTWIVGGLPTLIVHGIDLWVLKRLDGTDGNQPLATEEN
mmetsp:Transcript_18170/g.15840  ORF Transcript_18170/g.15840 Transcript_18170/m.15840 type:complete len:168 (+) Transcript_18170:72-575(+)